MSFFAGWRDFLSSFRRTPISSSFRRKPESILIFVVLLSRHPPDFVIPTNAPISSSRRKPGSSSLPLALGAFHETRPTSLCFFTRHPWRASHFLLLAQEKVTKEKGTPEGAVGRRSRPTARVRSGGSLTGHPWPDSERARVLRAPLRAFSSAHSPRPRGPEDQEQSQAKQHCFVF